MQKRFAKIDLLTAITIYRNPVVYGDKIETTQIKH